MFSRVTASRSIWGSPVGLAVVLAAALLIPYLKHTPAYRLSLYEQILAMIVVTIGLNVTMGMAGQFLLGIVAVFAVGGYATGYVVAHHPSGIGFIPMLILGALAGGVAGLILGIPSLRVGHFYLALVSLYATLVIPAVADQWSAVGGDGGLTLFATHFASGYGLYATFIGITLVVGAVGWLIRHSTVGRRFITLAASEELTAGLGISGYRTKLLGSVLGSMIAGLAGAMFVYSQQSFGPTSGGGGGGANLATLLLAALVIGGTGTIAGPVVGGVLILGLNQFLTGLADLSGVLFGALLIVFAVFLPQGITAEARKLAERLGFIRVRSVPVVGGPAAPTTAAGDSRPAATAARAAGPDFDHMGERPTASLEAVGVSRSFGGVRAVDNINLRVEPASIHGLIGSNGSGKTTLLNLISAFYKVDQGVIRIGDAVLSDHPAYFASRLGVARTFQTPKLILGASVLENVMPAVDRQLKVTGLESVFRLPRGVRTSRQSRQRAMDALERLSLTGIANDPAGALPHGTRRLVEVARAIALNPLFFLLDEPAAGLSPTESELLVEVIAATAREGVGVLLIEHNVPLVLSIARMVTVMHQGTQLFEGTPAELRSDLRVAGAFLGVDPTEVVT